MQPGGGFVETTGSAILQALPAVPSPPKPISSPACLPGFITTPFITACLDNAVVVPIVQPTGIPSWPISSYRTFPRGESNASTTTVNLSALSRRGISNGRKKGSSSFLDVPSQSSFCASIGNNLTYYRREKSNTRSRESGKVRWGERREESARRQNYGRLIASSRGELIKSILPERLAWGIEENSCRG